MGFPFCRFRRDDIAADCSQLYRRPAFGVNLRPLAGLLFFGNNTQKPLLIIVVYLNFIIQSNRCIDNCSFVRYNKFVLSFRCIYNYLRERFLNEI